MGDRARLRRGSAALLDMLRRGQHPHPQDLAECLLTADEPIPLSVRRYVVSLIAPGAKYTKRERRGRPPGRGNPISVLEDWARRDFRTEDYEAIRDRLAAAGEPAPSDHAFEIIRKRYGLTESQVRRLLRKARAKN